MSRYWWKLCCLKGGWVGHFERKFQGEGRSSTNDFWRQKTRVPGLSRSVVCVILRLAVLIQYWRVTHRQTHTDTDTHTDRQTLRSIVAFKCVMKNSELTSFMHY